MLTRPQRIRLYRLRWTAFVLVALAYMLSFFHRVAPAAVAGELQQAFQASGAALGSLAASYFTIYALMQVPTGVLVDTLGVRRIVALGGVIAGAGSILFGLADTLWTASLGRLLVGLGVSAMFLAMLKINALWFRERHFGTLAGLTVLLGNLGAVLAAAPLVWVLGFTTWRTVFVAVGFFSGILALLTWWLVRNHPGEAGLPTMRELEGLAPHPPHAGHWREGLIEVVSNRATWPGFLPAFGVAGTLLAFAGLWGVPFLRDVYSMPREVAVLHTTWLLAGFAVGAFFSGALSDRIRRRKPVMLGGIAFYLLCWLPLLFQWPLPLPAGIILFFLMGVGASGFTLAWAVAKEVNRPALSGMATGVVNTGAFLGAAILQPLIGWVMDLGWDGRMMDGARIYSAANHRAGVGILFFVATAGLLGALTVRETHCRHLAHH
ncbi:MAG: MFS transporter [Pseudomonadota bacterium]